MAKSKDATVNYKLFLQSVKNASAKVDASVKKTTEVRKNPLAIAYNVKNTSSLGNSDLPKNVVGTGVTNLVKRSGSEIPTKQSAIRKSKLSTGNVSGRYGIKVAQTVSDLKTQAKAQKAPSYNFLTGQNDANTSESTKQVNNAVGRTSVESGAKKLVHGKVMKVAKDEQSLISFKTSKGVITLPKTYDLKSVAHHFGISTESEKPSVLRHKIQRAIDRHPEDAGVKQGLEAMHKFRIGYSSEVRKLDQAEIIAANQTLQDKAISDARIKKNEAKFIARDVVKTARVNDGEDKLKIKADVLAGKKSMLVPDIERQFNTIMPASKFERKVEVNQVGGKDVVKTTYTGKQNPAMTAVRKESDNPIFKQELKELKTKKAKIESLPDYKNTGEGFKKLFGNNPFIYSTETHQEIDRDKLVKGEKEVITSSIDPDRPNLTLEQFNKESKEREASMTKSLLKNVESLKTSREHGDLSENAEYKAAKENQGGTMSMIENEKIVRAKINQMSVGDGKVARPKSETGINTSIPLKTVTTSGIKSNPKFFWMGKKSMAAHGGALTSSHSLKSEAINVVNKDIKALKKQYSGYVTGIEAYAPWAGGGNKAFVDMTPIKVAKESGGNVDAIMKSVSEKVTRDVNANVPKKASQSQLKVPMRKITGKVEGSDLVTLMKATSLKKPVTRTIPTNIFPESLATTIAKEDIAEHGKKKVMPSHDVPLRGTGAETKKSFVIKPSRRKNK